MNAILNVGRLNAFRLNYLPTELRRARSGRVTIWLGGVLATGRSRKYRLSVRDQLNDAPNTCALVIEGTAPTPGMDLRVSVNSNDPHLLFDGTLQTVDTTYEGLPSQLAWACSAVDDMMRANAKRPFGNWVDTSATTIAQQFVALFAPGFTTIHVQAGLPLASITFDGTETFGGALKRLADLIGGYCYVEDLDVHLFLTEATEIPDAIDMTPGRFLDSPPIMKTVDDSQLHTRVFGKGHGEAALTDVAVGATIIPIASTVMFNPLGGKAIAGTTPDGAQSQRLTYAGTQAGGVGSLAGPGVAPSAAPAAAVAAGAGIDNGVHQYAYTWVTAAGETRPSPLASVQHGAIPVPIAPIFQYTQSSGFHEYTNPGDVIRYRCTNGAYVGPSGENDVGVGGLHSDPGAIMTYTVLPQPSAPAYAQTITFLIPYSPDPRVKWVYCWHSVNGGPYMLTATAPNDSAGAIQFPGAAGYPVNNHSGYPLPYPMPASTSLLNRTTLGAIAVGPSATTSRKVYRTVAGGAQLKLQQTIAGNVATTGVTDATADAGLGANAPAADTSGLTTAAGQINAGSTELLTASAAPFSAAGGYVLVGAQVVRYTGIAGNSLTGIPASGPGSIVTTIPYGAPVTAAPALTGVAGIVQVIAKGAAVCIWIQRDDAAAQSARAAIDAAQGRTTDGVVEHTITDERRGEPSLIARCDADLKLFAYPIVTVTYDSRDLKTRSGKPVAFNLPSLGITGTLTIQDVTITEIDIAVGVMPRFHVVASSTRYSLEDILRQLLTEASAT